MCADFTLPASRSGTFADAAFFVVGCRRRYPWWQLPSADRRWKTAFELQEGLPLPGGCTVVVFDSFRQKRRLVRRLRALAGALVFER